MDKQSCWKAQGKVEAHNFEIRKQLLKYDDVMNDQRKVIFEKRKEIMSSDDISLMIKDMRLEVIQKIVSNLFLRTVTILNGITKN